MASFWTEYISVFIVIRIIQMNCDQRSLSYTNITFVQDDEVVNFSLTVKDSAFNVDVTTHKELSSIIMKIELYVKTGESAKYSQFSKSTTDMCAFFANPGSNLFLSIMIEHMRRTQINNIARHCPVKKVRFLVDVKIKFSLKITKFYSVTVLEFLSKNLSVSAFPQSRYYVTGYKFDTTNLPPFIPNLAFYVTTEVTSNDQKRILWMRVEGILENVVKKPKRKRRPRRFQ